MSSGVVKNEGPTGVNTPRESNSDARERVSPERRTTRALLAYYVLRSERQCSGLQSFYGPAPGLAPPARAPPPPSPPCVITDRPPLAPVATFRQADGRLRDWLVINEGWLAPL